MEQFTLEDFDAIPVVAKTHAAPLGMPELYVFIAIILILIVPFFIVRYIKEKFPNNKRIAIILSFVFIPAGHIYLDGGGAYVAIVFISSSAICMSFPPSESWYLVPSMSLLVMLCRIYALFVRGQYMPSKLEVSVAEELANKARKIDDNIEKNKHTNDTNFVFSAPRSTVSKKFGYLIGVIIVLCVIFQIFFRYSITVAPGQVAVYKFDRLTGKTWIITPNREMLMGGSQ